MSCALLRCGNPSSLRRYLQPWDGKVGEEGTLLALALQGMCKTIFSTDADTSKAGVKKKKINQNNALQCREETDQTSAVQLYSDPTKTLDHTPSFPSHTQTTRQSTEDGNCGMTQTQSTGPRVGTCASLMHRAEDRTCLSFSPSFDSHWEKKINMKRWYLITVSFNA